MFFEPTNSSDVLDVNLHSPHTGPKQHHPSQIKSNYFLYGAPSVKNHNFFSGHSQHTKFHNNKKAITLFGLFYSCMCIYFLPKELLDSVTFPNFYKSQTRAIFQHHTQGPFRYTHTHKQITKPTNSGYQNYDQIRATKILINNRAP